ncbi:hypothetical protein AVEN_32226-1, partial [Araneus ventricosus]
GGAFPYMPPHDVGGEGMGPPPSSCGGLYSRNWLGWTSWPWDEDQETSWLLVS